MSDASKQTVVTVMLLKNDCRIGLYFRFFWVRIQEFVRAWIQSYLKSY